jgi:putative transferase (TIGR04331 family)
MEEHQFSIADLVITWGWSPGKKTAAKAQPAFNLKRSGRTWKPCLDGDALLVGMSVPRYFYQLYSMPIGEQWLEYFEGQCKFVGGLDCEIRKKILVRLYQPDYGWRQKERWREQFPKLRMDEGHINIDKLVRRSRLYISTYNATTFLESLHDNFPSLIFWNPRHFELRQSAKPLFHALESAGIFHSTPESAAKHLNFHWDRLEKWWHGDPVQEARRLFCHQYSRQCPRPLVLLKKILEESASPEVLPS